MAHYCNQCVPAYLPFRAVGIKYLASKLSELRLSRMIIRGVVKQIRPSPPATTQPDTSCSKLLTVSMQRNPALSLVVQGGHLTPHTLQAVLGVAQQ